MKKVLIFIGGAIVAILLFVSGCFHGKKLVKPVTKYVEVEVCDTMYQTDTLKLVKTAKGKIIYIANQEQLDSLKDYYSNLIQYKDEIADSLKAVYAELGGAAIGDMIIDNTQYYLMRGMAFTEEGDTLLWDVWVTDTTAIVAGTPEKPNPVFRVIQHEEVPVDVPPVDDDATAKFQRRNSISFAVLTSYDGKAPTIIPMAKLQIHRAGYMVGYDLNNRRIMLGVSTRELHFGKPR